jgi:erythromycin esterase
VSILARVYHALVMRGFTGHRLSIFLLAAIVACAAPPSQTPLVSSARAPAESAKVEARAAETDEVVPWLHDHLSPITTDDPGASSDDLAVVRSVVGDARVIGLGEATHGTREFFRLKHRILAYLAKEMGPCTLAMEADFADAVAIDHYVSGGSGSLRAAIDALYLVWRTEEVADLLEWMRAFNADPSHPHKIRFFGFDAQNARAALREVRAYLQRVDTKTVPTLSALAPLEKVTDEAPYRAVEAKDRARIRPALDALVARFDSQHAEYVRRSSEAEWALARQEAVTAKQAERVLSAEGNLARFTARDQAMADNVRWIAKSGAPDSRVAVWAHNGHIAHTTGAPMMGTRLREALGTGYVAMGLFFDSGSFQTFDVTGGRFKWKETTLGPSPDHFASAKLAKTGVPMFMVDLRARPQPKPVADWLIAEHPIREVGHTFESEERATRDISLGDEVDAALFVARTTRARPAKR